MSVPAVGAVLGNKYRVIAAIGAGAMGTVFRAQNIVTGKQVALKWMHPHIAANPDSSTRLLREAQAASRLSHPNVIDVYDFIQDENTLFLVMELLQGETLRAYLLRNRQPKISEFIALLTPALAGVAAAHEQGVIHRDLKPDNIFLVQTPGALLPTAKVVDFGVAKLDGDQGLTLTGTGAAVGTPIYMSLEQLRGDKNIDARTDVYAFGVMLYEAIAGQLPYSASTLSGLAIKVLTTEPVSLKTLRPDVPTSLTRVVDWAIAKRREDRLSSVRGLMQELEAFSREYSFRQEMTHQGDPTPLLAPERLAAVRDNEEAGAVRAPSTHAVHVSPLRAGPGPLRAGQAEEKDARVDPQTEAATAAVAGTFNSGKTRKRLTTLWLGGGALAMAMVVAAFVWMGRAEPATAPARASDERAMSKAAESSAEPYSAQAVGLSNIRSAVGRDASTRSAVPGEPEVSELTDAEQVRDAATVDGGLVEPEYAAAPPQAELPRQPPATRVRPTPTQRVAPRPAKRLPEPPPTPEPRPVVRPKTAADELAF
ncbi:MAG: hypothetical protein RLZZ450_5629 [Pseudomonadota bacterium]